MRSLVPPALNQFGHFLTPDQCSVLGVRVVILFWRKRNIIRDLSCFGSCLISCDYSGGQDRGLGRWTGEEAGSYKWSSDQI